MRVDSNILNGALNFVDKGNLCGTIKLWSKFGNMLLKTATIDIKIGLTISIIRLPEKFTRRHSTQIR